MTYFAFNLAGWTVLFFVAGMIKPKWPLFFLKEPNRFLIVIISTVLVMITFTLYGEGVRRTKLEEKAKIAATEKTAPKEVSIPVPAAPEVPVIKK